VPAGVEAEGAGAACSGACQASSGVPVALAVVAGVATGGEGSPTTNRRGSGARRDRALTRRRGARGGSTGTRSGRASGCSCATGAGLLGNPAVFEQPDDARQGDGAAERVDAGGPHALQPRRDP
jgi:hypothetical protein